MEADRLKEARILAEEVLREAEVASGSIEALVLKAARLARLVNDEQIRDWLYLETFGYHSTGEIAQHYLAVTCRWVDKEKDKAYFGSAATQEIAIRNYEVQRDAAKAFVPSGQYSLVQLENQMNKISTIGGYIATHSKILSSIRAAICDFALRISEELSFSAIGADIFETYRIGVDAVLAELAEDTFKKWPHIYERLSVGDAEAVSHAMTTCRRIVDGVAEKLFPPGTTSINLGQDMIDCSAGKTRNRLRAFVKLNCVSSGQADRLCGAISKIYDRVSTGVHADLKPDEARAVVINTYVMLGEIAHIWKSTTKPV